MTASDGARVAATHQVLPSRMVARVTFPEFALHEGPQLGDGSFCVVTVRHDGYFVPIRHPEGQPCKTLIRGFKSHRRLWNRSHR